MARVLKTAIEIQAIVSDRLHSLREVIADRSTIRVPLPRAHPPDGTGANWDMGVFGGDALGHVPAIRTIVGAARQEFELVRDEAGECRTFIEEQERQEDA